MELPSMGKKNGKVDMKDYTEDPSYLAKLAPVVEKLKAEVPEAKYDAKSLAELAAQLQQFQEEVLGKDGSNKRQPKIPARLFRDVTPSGALYAIAMKCYDIKSARDLRRIEWANQGKRRECTDMLVNITRELVEKGHLVKPTIWLHPGLNDDMASKCKDIIKKLGGTTCDSPTDEKLTHKVYGNPPSGGPDFSKHLARVLEVRGERKLVHWFYLPDSYDELLPGSAVTAEPAPPPTSAVCKVHYRWVTDSDRFNEWMNPADYDMSASAPEEQQEPQQQQAEEAQAAAAGLGPEPMDTEQVAGAAGGAAGAGSAAGAAGAGGSKEGGGAGTGAGAGASAPAGAAAGAGGEAKQVAQASALDLSSPAAAAAGASGAAAGAAGSTAAGGKGGQAAGAAKGAGGAAGAAGGARPGAGGASGSGAAGQQGQGQAGGSGAAAAGDDGAPAAKRHKPEHRTELEEGAGVRVGINVVKQKCQEPHRPTMEASTNAENLSQGQLAMTHAGAVHAPRVAAAEGGVAPPVLGPRAPVPPVPPVRQELYTIPSYAAWFHMDRIHEKERMAVPEFFDGKSVSRTSKAYREARNLMINMYRADPGRRLTFTEARSKLQGDVTALYKVWSFLDNWGVINFSAPDLGHGVGTSPAALELVMQPSTSGAAGGGMGHGLEAYRLTTHTLAPTPANMFAFGRPTISEGVAAAASGGNTLNLTARRNTYGRSALDPPGSRPQFFCNAMPWVDCSDLRYHCTKYPDIDLCPEAFAEGRFPPGACAKDFVRIDAKRTGAIPMMGDDKPWSSQETLLLLEGLEMHGDNWAEVAEHVGTKSQVACIMHFLSLPMEEALLDDLESGVSSARRKAAPGGAAGGGTAHLRAGALLEGQTPTQGKDIPFIDEGNPVMSQIAFLATMVGPRVAAAAAQRALEVLSEDDAAVAAEAARGMANAAGAMDGSSAAPAPPAPPSAADPAHVPISVARMKTAAAAALGAAAVRAKMMADAEEREVQRLVAEAVEAQARKVEIKLQHLEQLEQILEAERARVAAQRKGVDAERVALQEARTKQHAAAAPMEQ